MEFENRNVEAAFNAGVAAGIEFAISRMGYQLSSDGEKHTFSMIISEYYRVQSKIEACKNYAK